MVGEGQAGGSRGPDPKQPTPKKRKGGKGSLKEKVANDNAKKAEVSKNLNSGVYSLGPMDDKPLQSPAWLKFGRVLDQNGAKLPYVQCRNPECGLVKMFTSGRGNLVDHICSKKKTTILRPPSKEAITKFIDSLASLCAVKVLPMTIVEGEAFQEVIQNVVDMVDCFGKIDPAVIIPHPTTLARHVKAKADKARQVLVESMKDDLEDGFGSATVDGWTDGQRGRKYLTHTVSLIDKDFNLNEHVLFTPHCDAESVTAPVINEEIKSNLAGIGLNPDTPLHYVTDDGADIVCAVRESERTYCADHCTNLTVKKALTVQLTKTDLYGTEGGDIVDSVAKAVRTIKSSRVRGLQALKAKLVLGPKDRNHQSRFKSCLPMLSSVKKNFQQVKLSIQKMGFGFLDDLSQEDITAVLEIVTPVEKLAQQQRDKVFVAAHLNEVQNLTATQAGESSLRTSIKDHIRAELTPILSILQLLQKLKSVVTLMKTTGLNDTLIGGTLKQEVETRWMSVLRLLKSFFVADGDHTRNAKLDQINQILQDKNRLDLLISQNDAVTMEQLIDLLEHFEIAIKKFEAEKVPTIQHVLPQFRELEKAVAPKADDSSAIAALKARLSVQLRRKFAPNISMRHKIGAFLWPKFSALPNTLMSSEERAEVLAAVRTLCAKEAATLASRQPPSPSPSPSPPKRRRNDGSDRSDSEDEYAELCQPQGPVQDEVDLYMFLAARATRVKSKGILQWWKEKQAALPALSRVARKILATPASSSASERIFSVAGRLISSRRTCLLPETVNDILFLHDFYKKMGLRIV